MPRGAANASGDVLEVLMEKYHTPQNIKDPWPYRVSYLVGIVLPFSALIFSNFEIARKFCVGMHKNSQAIRPKRPLSENGRYGRMEAGQSGITTGE